MRVLTHEALCKTLGLLWFLGVRLCVWGGGNISKLLLSLIPSQFINHYHRIWIE